PYLIPPEVVTRSADQGWLTFGEALDEAQGSGKESQGLKAYAGMLRAYVGGDAATFNNRLEAYRDTLEKKMPTQVAKADFEVFFSDFSPFIHCIVLYLIVFFLSSFSWLASSYPLPRH